MSDKKKLEIVNSKELSELLKRRKIKVVGSGIIKVSEVIE